MLAGSCLGCAAQENVRLHAEEGWRIPGLSRILAAKPEKEETLDAGGAALRARTFRTGGAGSYRVLFLSRKDDTNYVQWLSIAPRKITAYSYGGRLVSVMVDGVVRLATDPKSGEGGSGGEVGDAGTGLREGLQPGRRHRCAQFGEGALHQAQVHRAHHAAVLLGEFEERAVPQPDPSRPGLLRVLGAGRRGRRLRLRLGVEAEVVAVAPFVSHNGIVARALERLLMVARGVDPTSLVVPEAGHLALRREYESNLVGYQEGGPGGVHAWLLYAAEAYAAGANASPLRTA